MKIQKYFNRDTGDEGDKIFINDYFIKDAFFSLYPMYPLHPC